MDKLQINPVSLIRVLSMALGLTLEGVNMHHVRVAILCRNIAERMNMPFDGQQKLVEAALLHDIGAASSHNERRTLLTPDGEDRLGVTIHTHAEKGYSLLRGSRCFSGLADIVRLHHSYWDGTGNPSGLEREAIPLESHIIHLADRVDVLINARQPVLQQTESICDNIKSKSGTQFSPQVTGAFLESAQAERFWLDINNTGYAETFFAEVAGWGQQYFSLTDVLDIAELFASLIDRISPFTATHSRSVSGVAALLAGQCGFSSKEQSMIRIAGLLHDLGKLSVPNAILEKNGKLDKQEFCTIRQHTYYTYRLLEQIDSFEAIAEWAAFHHETLDGSGYPFKKKADSLPLGSRIMAVADIFVALSENRPYRDGLDRESIERIMYGMADSNKIDRHIVAVLFDNFQSAYDVVRSAEAMPHEKLKNALRAI
ncbi:MAG: HD domain-containing protein [Desulfovibrio sp.]|nr:HD domain-containing protein [Desulfovibrio sp.]